MAAVDELLSSASGNARRRLGWQGICILIFRGVGQQMTIILMLVWSERVESAGRSSIPATTAKVQGSACETVFQRFPG